MPIWKYRSKSNHFVRSNPVWCRIYTLLIISNSLCISIHQSMFSSHTLVFIMQCYLMLAILVSRSQAHWTFHWNLCPSCLFIFYSILSSRVVHQFLLSFYPKKPQIFLLFCSWQKKNGWPQVCWCSFHNKGNWISNKLPAAVPHNLAINVSERKREAEWIKNSKKLDDSFM